MSAASAPTVHVEQSMGTMFSIDIRDPGDWGDVIDDVCALLHHIDAVFSTYRPDSDICRIQRGELSVGSADPLVAEVIGLGTELQRATDGFFSAMYDGRLDPTGVVKGWAIERASRLLRTHGSHHHAIGGGGDVQVAGEAASGQPWRIGISDPRDRSRVLASVSARDCAVATSGTSERGAHIIDPFTGRPATRLAAVTVVHASLTVADAYATAAFVMGDHALSWLGSRPDCEGMVVARDGDVRTTHGFPALWQR